MLTEAQVARICEAIREAGDLAGVSFICGCVILGIFICLSKGC